MKNKIYNTDTETEPVVKPQTKPVVEPDKKDDPIEPLNPPKPKVIPVPKNFFRVMN